MRKNTLDELISAAANIQTEIIQIFAIHTFMHELQTKTNVSPRKNNSLLFFLPLCNMKQAEKSDFLCWIHTSELFQETKLKLPSNKYRLHKRLTDWLGCMIALDPGWNCSEWGRECCWLLEIIAKCHCATGGFVFHQHTAQTASPLFGRMETNMQALWWSCRLTELQSEIQVLFIGLLVWELSGCISGNVHIDWILFPII